MSALDEKGVDAVFSVIWPQTEWNEGEAFCRAVAEKAIRTYLASVSPALPEDVARLVERLRHGIRYLSRTADDAAAKEFNAYGDSIVVNEGDFWNAVLAMPDAADALTALVARTEAAEAEIASLKARLEEAGKVIEPFAKVAAYLDEHNPTAPDSVSLGHLRAARRFAEGER